MITDLVTMRAQGLAVIVAVVAVIVTLATAGCGGSATSAAPAAPEAVSDAPARPVSAKGKRWKGWRYDGARDACFFIVGRTCFETEDSACAAAACADGKRCATDGAGPATVRCE
jgi:hypothetical protein